MSAFAYPAPPPPIPAGWYDDPTAPGRQRWWNGSAWTEQTAETGGLLSVPAIGQSAPIQNYPSAIAQSPQSTSGYPSPAALPSRRELRGGGSDTHPTLGVEEQAPVAYSATPFAAAPFATAPVATAPFTTAPFTSAPTTTAPVSSVPAIAAPRAIAAAPFVPADNPWAPPLPPPPVLSVASDISFEVEYTPFSSIPAYVTGAPIAPERTYTAAAWALVVTPALLAASLVATAMVLGSFYTQFVQMGLALVFTLIMFGLAIRDGRELRESGYSRTASPAWLLLSPIAFFIARFASTKRAVGAGAWTLVANLIVSVLVIAAIGFALAIAPQLATTVLVAR